MNITDLKIFTGIYITEQDNLTKEEKFQLLDFVQNATEKQVLFLLTEGYMKEDEKINNTVVLKEDPLTNMIFGVGKLTAAFVAALVIKGAYKIYKKYLTKIGRECYKYIGNRRVDCITKFKQEALKAQINTLNKGKSNCNKSKQPKKCVEKIDSKIQKLKEKLSKYK